MPHAYGFHGLEKHRATAFWSCRNKEGGGCCRDPRSTLAGTASVVSFVPAAQVFVISSVSFFIHPLPANWPPKSGVSLRIGSIVLLAEVRQDIEEIARDASRRHPWQLLSPMETFSFHLCASIGVNFGQYTSGTTSSPKSLTFRSP
jgi:hypothetical protein